MTQIEILERFFQFLGEGRIDEWASLLDANVVASTPFSPKGSDTEFCGIAEVRARFGDARIRMSALRFVDIDIQGLNSPNRYVVTCRSEGAFAAGVEYKNNYCWLFRLDADHICEWVEYFDPQEVVAVRTALMEKGAD